MHTADDVVECLDRLHDVRTFVEHDAFGAIRHRRVSDLGAGWQAFFRERLEYLCCPDHGYVGRLAEPENLLLDFCKALEAALHGKITPRDHHGIAGRLHRFEQHRR